MKIKFYQSVGLIVFTGIVLSSCVDENKSEELQHDSAVAVQVGIPVRRSDENIAISGQIESRETAIVSTRVMGFISNIPVKLGDRVRKGQLLVSISDNDIRAKVAQAEAMISEAQSALADAQKDNERYEELHRKQSASTKELENITLHYKSVQSKLETARQMKNEANAMLAYTNLMAPFDGVVTQVNADSGSMANPGMPILSVERNDHLVKAYVSEEEVGKLKNGMIADVLVKSIGKLLKGKISEISPSSQFTGGQFLIKILVLENENATLFSGMDVSVSIRTKDDATVVRLFVPASAIVNKDQLSGLYTVTDDQTAQLRWLKLGKESNGEVEVLSGLSPGEMFITQSEGRLYSGVAVKVASIN
ncbi:RND transporter [Cytophagales bacterium WSM2-2]|nr:RND transporter [Cytophagales bacterium WSM2-2]